MAGKSVTLDLKKMLKDISGYFSHLTMDMKIAWAVLGLGLIMVILGLILL